MTGVLLRWLRLDTNRRGAIPAFGGSFYILQRGDYVKRGDDVGSEWYELEWTDVPLEDFG